MSTQIPYVDAQVNLAQLCDRVVETGEAVIVTRPDKKMLRWFLKLSYQVYWKHCICCDRLLMRLV